MILSFLCFKVSLLSSFLNHYLGSPPSLDCLFSLHEVRRRLKSDVVHFFLKKIDFTATTCFELKIFEETHFSGKIMRIFRWNLVVDITKKIFTNYIKNQKFDKCPKYKCPKLVFNVGQNRYWGLVLYTPPPWGQPMENVQAKAKNFSGNFAYTE